MKAIMVEPREVEGILCTELTLLHKNYATDAKDSAGVDIPNGATAMSWLLKPVDTTFTTIKGLDVPSEDVQGVVEVKQKLIDVGWITEADSVMP